MSTLGTRRSRSRNVTWLVPLGVIWLASACAGRSESLSQMPDGSSGASGSLGTAGAGQGHAGAGQAGNPVMVAGAPGVGATSGGAGAPPGAAGAPPAAAGAGGASNLCDNVDCPDIVCGNGSEPVVPPGACCASCQCKQVCNVQCPIDTHASMQAGQCCPVCVSNTPPPPSCDDGKKVYAAARAQMLEKYSQGCSADSQCVTMTVANACESCQPVALTSAAAMSFSSNTSSNAKQDCAACPPIAIPPCIPPPQPVCINNVCKLPVP